ncbi:MAG: hypothetical protein ACOCVR_04540, partial [Myxococcota bacterium]
TCDDQIRNGDETDVDCGGPDCLPCPDDKQCLVDTDCINESCIDGICDPGDTCENGVKDGNESDVDCGGDCGPCEDGFECNEEEDCEPVFVGWACEEGVCGGMYTCIDYEVSGRETDVDCGGGICRACAGGKDCEEGADCLTGECVEGVCSESEYTCDNGVKDGYETDIDCGSDACPPCGDGFFCEFDADCEWENCEDGVCDPWYACQDEIVSGHETDVDCGGPVCDPCETGKSCEEDTDCVSESCVDGTCA